MSRSLSTVFSVVVLVVGTLFAVGSLRASDGAAPFGAPPSTAETATTTTTDVPTTTATTSTTAVSTTTEPTPTTVTTGSHDPPIRTTAPTSVVASNDTVGVGGQIGFVGTCGEPFGTVFVQITGATTVLVDTGLTGTTWTYTWTAPTDPRLISTFTFEFWCGDPSGAGLTLPPELRRSVAMVASLPPTTAAPRSTGGQISRPATVTLPETR